MRSARNNTVFVRLMKGFLRTNKTEKQSSITTCKSLTVLSCFSGFHRLTLPIFFPSTMSISYRIVFRCRRFSNIRFSFKWTPCNWGKLSPSFLLTNKLKSSDLSSDFLFPYKWNARASKRHKLSWWGCFGLSSNVKQFRVWKFSGGCVMNCPCNPQVRFSVKLQKLLKLSTCRNSTLCSFFHYYATLWRPFVMNIHNLCRDFLIAQIFWSNHQCIVFVCVQMSESSISYSPQNESKC